jgi:hypothetical protein
MNFIKEIFSRSKAFAWLGTIFLVQSIVLVILLPFNELTVLGINSLLKPLKFALSLWIYSWTMAYFVYYVRDKITVKRFEILAVVIMVIEQGIVTVQASRGTLSHFNISTPTDGLLFSLMGTLIATITTYTLWVAIKFKIQKDDINIVFKEAMFLGLMIFIISGYLGFSMASRLTHNVGGEMGGASLPFLNWSTTIGDLRVAHFIGLHGLQIIPLIGVFIMKYVNDSFRGVLLIRIISFVYMSFIALTFMQALMGQPFIRM